LRNKRTGFFKALFYTVIILAPFALFGGVFELFTAGGETIAPGIKAPKGKSLEFRINGAPASLKNNRVDGPAREVLDAVYDYAESKGALFYSGRVITAAAAALFNAAAQTGADEAFGYIFYTTKEAGAELVIAGSSGSITDVVRMSLAPGFDSPGRGYNDGMKHMKQAKRMLSLELASGRKTAYFANFYTAENISAAEARAYYSDYFRRGGYSVLLNERDEDGEIFMVKKRGAETVVRLSEDGAGAYIMVAG